MSNNADQRIVDSGLGLTKREYFAGLAFQGLMASDVSDSIENIAYGAVAAADALLAELAKEPT